MPDMPYAVAAMDYFEAGWSPIPLPYKEKSPPPDGYTGADGKPVDLQRVRAWTGAGRQRPVRAHSGNLTYPPGNIALRLPPEILGIDVDMYDGKKGRETIELAEKQWGPLPPTWSSSSRQDGSGIRLYRIPPGLHWPGQVGPGVETIRWDHRFAIVAPSLHDKTGTTYRWTNPQGEASFDEIPAPGDCTELLPAWVEGLTKGAVWVEREVSTMTEQEVREWIAARDAPECSVMRATLAQYSRQLREAGEDGGAHEVARNGAWALIGDAAAGHGGLTEALIRLKKVLVEGVRTRRGQKELDGEWKRIVIRGVKKVAAEGAPAREDMCALLSSDRAPTSPPESGGSGAAGESPSGSGKAGSGGYEYMRDDIGNAQRLVQRVGSDGKYVPAWDAWALYNPSSGLWEVDPAHGGIRREAMAVVRAMDAEAEYIEDPRAKANFKAFIRASGSAGKLKAMIELAEGLRGVACDPNLFDADPTLLVCSNGCLVLGRDGLQFRQVRHSDYATFSTRVPYDPQARSADWDRFIDRVLPDPHTRRWVQTLAGYSLLGANTERVLVIAKGETTSGKTTFAEALRAALGAYAGPFNLSLFREKQDEGPRADVVGVIGRRLLLAAEASAEWTLHADTIKRFTGGEPVQARRLNSNILVERVPAFAPWIFTNSYPQVPGADLALWRRIKAAPFNVSIPEEEVDTDLRLRILSPAVAPVVLAWCVQGWEFYCADGLRDPSHEALLMSAEARDEMSDLDLCLSQVCTFGAELSEASGRLYDAYRQWMELNGDTRRVLSQTAWGRAMSGKGYEKLRAAPVAGSSARVWYRRGLALTPEWQKAVGAAGA